MKALILAFALAGCSAAQPAVSASEQMPLDPPGEALPDSAWTHLQCFDAGTSTAMPSAELIGSSVDGTSHVYMDEHGIVSMIRAHGDRTEVCQVINRTGGYL